MKGSKLLLALLAAVCATVVFSGKEEAKGAPLLVRHATVMTLGPKGTLENADILSVDGKITAVGPGLQVPEGAVVLEAEGKTVFPVLFQGRSTLGMRGQRGNDEEAAVRAVAPDLDAFFAVDTFHRSFREVRLDGLGAAFVAPGAANLIGGMGVILKPRTGVVDDLIVKRDAAMVMSFGEEPKAAYRGKIQTRMGAAAAIRSAFLSAKDYRRRWERYEEQLEKTKDPSKAPRKPDTNYGEEAMLKVLRKKIPVVMTAHRLSDIETALRLADEFDFRLVLEGATDAHLLASELARREIPVIFGPMRQSEMTMEKLRHTPQAPRLLHQAGVKVAIRADEGGMYGPEGVRELPLDAAFAHANGLGEEAALKAITLTPAEILGIADRLGSLEEGKDADFVIYSGHPFKTKSLPEITVLDGQVAARR
jgi:imidazolonepropionase-like amidohydrolase